MQQGRRKFLITVTSVVSGAGVAALATPFLLSMSPSARAGRVFN
ncbi:MAG TPA: ubiquinol-cytochrome c reductase iron-sulfur subunit N-terminal domain-containing protein [Thiolinea sp.]|nr:ubiquinol-cytochrome c reductase iron-sulfur subunit N-terminal domain-containing protein [Thiolinea sp.]